MLLRVFLKERDHFRRVLLLLIGVLTVTILAFFFPVSPRKVEKPQQFIMEVSSTQRKMSFNLLLFFKGSSYPDLFYLDSFYFAKGAVNFFCGRCLFVVRSDFKEIDSFLSFYCPLCTFYTSYFFVSRLFLFLRDRFHSRKR